MPFKDILKELVEAIPGASGAILTDWEGEAVECYCLGDDYELKVTGAHKGIILNRLKDIHGRIPTGDFREAFVTTGTQRMVFGVVGPEYVLVVTLNRDVLAALALQRFRGAVKLLEKEIY